MPRRNRKQVLNERARCIKVTFSAMLRQFFRLNSVRQKMEYVGTELKKIGLIYSLTTSVTHTFIVDKKSDDKANALCEFANKCVANGDLKEAHKSLCIAITHAQDQQLLCLIYTKRTEVLFSMQLYKDCLLDIENSFNCGCECKVLRRELLSRRKQCLQLLKLPDTYYSEIPKSPLAPGTGNCFETVVDNKRAKAIAKRHIEIGEIILVEKAFSICQHSLDTTHCSECLTLSYRTVPCENCTQVLYCGELCKIKALKYHKYECPILRFIHHVMDSAEQVHYHLHALRLTILSIMDEAENGDSSIYLQRKNLEKISTGVFSENSPMSFDLCCIFARFCHLMEEHTRFFEDYKESRLKFKEYLFENYLIAEANCVSVSEFKGKESGKKVTAEYTDTQTVIYPSFYKFNHSCLPNVLQHYYGTTLVLVACRSIRKGEECLVNRSVDYTIGDFEVRHHFLRGDSGLEICECVVCEEVWPMDNKHAILMQKCKEYETVKQRLLNEGSREYAREVLEKYIPILRGVESKLPSLDYDLVSTIFKYCHRILGNKCYAL